MIDQQIRDYIDSLAQPLTLDEIIDTSVVTPVVPRSSHRVTPWAIAAVLIAVLSLVGLAIIASRDTDSVASVATEPVGLQLTPDDPQVGTSFVATLTGDDLEALSVRAEAYIEQLNGDTWQRIWLVHPVFLDATESPAEPVDLITDGVPPGVSPIRLAATRPLRVVLPRQLEAGSYRFCLQADQAGSSTGNGDYCAPIVVQNSASTVTSLQPIGSVPSGDGSTSIGTEEPLVETDITTVRDVAKPGSAHSFHVEGHPPVLLWTTLMPNLQTGDVEEWQCVSEAFGSACGSTAIPAQFSQTSSIDNHVASDDLFAWSNLPPEVDTVRYDDGVTKLWQHPVAGLAVFRVDPDHPHPDITAYDATGATLPYSFWGQNLPLKPATETTGKSVTVETSDPVAVGQNFGELQSLTQSSIHDCLTANGATWITANVPTFAEGVDPSAIWKSCVERVQSIVAARQAELGKGP